MREIIRYTTLNFLLLDFIGDKREFSKEKVNALLERKQFFIELKEVFPEIDLTMYKEEDFEKMNSDLQDLSIACWDKLEVRNNSGFCQVLAYAAEMIQRYSSWKTE